MQCVVAWGWQWSVSIHTYIIYVYMLYQMIYIIWYICVCVNECIKHRHTRAMQWHAAVQRRAAPCYGSHSAPGKCEMDCDFPDFSNLASSLSNAVAAYKLSRAWTSGIRRGNLIRLHFWLAGPTLSSAMADWNSTHLWSTWPVAAALELDFF